MDTSKLRQKLLDLAIRGKLVPQDPNDEPASALLERIHAEKVAMVERGELKPKDVKDDTVIYIGSDGLPYEKRWGKSELPVCIEDENIFELPKGWAWAKLGTLGNWRAGSTPTKSRADYYDNGAIPWLLTGDLNDGVVNEVPHHITKLALDECSLRINPVGTLLIAMYGATIGKVGILGIPATTNQACCACVLYDSDLSQWVFTWLLSHKPVFTRLGLGGAQSNISKDIIVSQYVPLPPLAEQRRIVETLGKHLALIDEIEQAQADLDALFAQLKSKVLDLAIRGELTAQDPNDEPADKLLERIHTEKVAMVERGELKPKDIKSDTVIFTGSDGLRYEKLADGDGKVRCIEEEIPFEIPEGWAWSRLGSLGNWRAGSTPTKSRTDYHSNGAVPWLLTGDLNDGIVSTIPQYITEKAVKECSLRINPVGSILVAMYGATIGKIGILGIPATTNQACCACIPYIQDSANWISMWLFSHKPIFAELGMGGAQPNISKEIIISQLIPLPPLAEQNRILNVIRILASITN